MLDMVTHTQQTCCQDPNVVTAASSIPGSGSDVLLVHFAVLLAQVAPGNTGQLGVVTALEVLALPEHSMRSVLPPALWSQADGHLCRHRCCFRSGSTAIAGLSFFSSNSDLQLKACLYYKKWTHARRR